MRVLITGAGLVGAHVAAELAAAAHVPLLFDASPVPNYVAAVAGPLPVVRGDVVDPAAVTRALREHGAQAVVHTAGLLGAKCARRPYLAFHVNAGGSAAVAEAARRCGVARLVHISSLAVYDWDAVAPGAAVGEDFPTAPRTPYGVSKLAGELAVRCYHRQGWLTVTVLRMAGVYGPGHFRGGGRFGFQLQRSLARALAGEPVAVPAELAGHEYLHAGDAARAVRWVLEHDVSGIYNIGTGRLHDTTDVATAIRCAVPGASVTAAPAPPPVEVPLDLQRARRDLPGWGCRDLTTGLSELAGTLRRHPWLVVLEEPGRRKESADPGPQPVGAAVQAMSTKGER